VPFFPATDMSVTVSQATVLSSGFSTRICRTVAVARAVGISALTSVTGCSRERSGPGGSALASAGQRRPLARTVTCSPSGLVSV